MRDYTLYLRYILESMETIKERIWLKSILHQQGQ